MAIIVPFGALPGLAKAILEMSVIGNSGKDRKAVPPSYARGCGNARACAGPHFGIRELRRPPIPS
jgi:hypothetical protein